MSVSKGLVLLDITDFLKPQILSLFIFSLFSHTAQGTLCESFTRPKSLGNIEVRRTEILDLAASYGLPHFIHRFSNGEALPVLLVRNETVGALNKILPHSAGPILNLMSAHGMDHGLWFMGQGRPKPGLVIDRWRASRSHKTRDILFKEGVRITNAINLMADSTSWNIASVFLPLQMSRQYRTISQNWFLLRRANIIKQPFSFEELGGVAKMATHRSLRRERNRLRTRECREMCFEFAQATDLPAVLREIKHRLQQEYGIGQIQHLINSQIFRTFLTRFLKKLNRVDPMDSSQINWQMAQKTPGFSKVAQLGPRTLRNTNSQIEFVNWLIAFEVGTQYLKQKSEDPIGSQVGVGIAKFHPQAEAIVIFDGSAEAITQFAAGKYQRNGQTIPVSLGKGAEPRESVFDYLDGQVVWGQNP